MPRILSACPSGSATSSLTLTICPAWPGSGRRRSAGRSLSGREKEIVTGTGQNAPAGLSFLPVTDPRTVQNRYGMPPCAQIFREVSGSRNSVTDTRREKKFEPQRP